MEVRVKEHEAHTSHSGVDLSAVEDHAIVLGHQMDREHPQLLDRERNVWSRKSQRGPVAKKKQNKTMNKDRGMELSPLWFSVI